VSPPTPALGTDTLVEAMPASGSGIVFAPDGEVIVGRQAALLV
jgi:hypothetical protein